MLLRRSLRYQVRATNWTEVPKLPRRWLKSGQLLLALQPAEVFALDTRSRSKHGCMGFATSTAMTMTNRHVELIDLILDSAT
jgi:hypothetical protein